MELFYAKQTDYTLSCLGFYNSRLQSGKETVPYN